MRVTSLIGVLLIATCAALGETGIFDDAPPPAAPGTPVFDEGATKALQQQAAKLRFVIGATPKTIGDKWDQALAQLDAAIAEASSSANTARLDALKARRGELAATAGTAKKTPMLPSLYPLELGKKGCLYAVRESDITLRAGQDDPKPLSLGVQVISWFSVKVTRADDDGSLLCDIYENSGKILLYRAVLEKLENPAMKAGVSAQLVNVAFECTLSEQTDAGTVYHLTKIPAQSLIANAPR